MVRLRVRGPLVSIVLTVLWSPSTPCQADQFRRFRIVASVAGERAVAYLKPSHDLNGDRYDDYLVHYGGGYYCGGCPAVVVLASGLDGRPLWAYPSPMAPAAGRGGEADVGDFDGDGGQEIVLGWYEIPSKSGLGHGLVTAQSLDGSHVLWAREAEDGVWWFGRSVHVPGDVTGDGIDDVIVYANWIEGLPPNAGRLWVLSGRDGSDVYVYTGTTPGESLGELLHHGLRDVDADGHVDFAYNSFHPDSLWIRSGRDGSLLWQITDADEIPGYLRGLGDLDGDGFDDVVYALGASGHGRSIAASVLDQRVIWEFDYPAEVPMMAQEPVADIDHDGVDDLVLSQTGRRRDEYPYGSVIALSGRTGTMLWEMRDSDPPEDVDRFGDDAFGIGDVNGDGLRDLTIFRTVLPDRNREAVIYTRNTLHKVPVGTITGHIDLSLTVPSCPERIFALLFAMAEGSVPLGLRYVPLAPDWLLLWSVAHPLWGVLDAQGKATINVASHLSLPGGPASGEVLCAGIVFDPSAPFGIRTITNRVVLEEE
ncbi:MAG: integrin alpha [Planctomycetota bacterium]